MGEISRDRIPKVVADELMQFASEEKLRSRIAALEAENKQINALYLATGRDKDHWKSQWEQLQSENAELRRDRDRLSHLINNPHTDDFLEAVRLESAHQRERWGSEHDAGKTDPDWFWLVGYLAGKALSKPEKQIHHIITTAAACLNWHANKTGASTSMRPGIMPPMSEQPAAKGEEQA